jgi:leucyl aminopeptidase
MKLMDYKGYEIHVDEKGLFEARKYEESDGFRSYTNAIKSKETIRQVQESIDRHLKAEGKRIKIIFLESDKITEGEITSLAEGNYYARVSFSGYYKGQITSEQKSLHNLYHATPENREKLVELATITKELDLLRAKYSTLEKTLTSITAKEIIEG